MKKFQILFLAFAFISLGMTITSCGNKAATTDATEEVMEAADDAMEATTEAVDMTGPEYTSAYICSMHCEGSGSAEPGKCPKCGMDYVANVTPEGEDHEGHDH